MSQEKIKVYIYTRVSTTMQIDGYSLDPLERKKLMEHLISEIQIYPERQPNGQWLKSIKFRLPIIENGADLCLDNGSHVEVVSCYTKTM